MSKLIEALKRHGGEFSSTPSEQKPKELHIEKSSHELTQEQLAEIYFSATGKPKNSEPPVIIKVIEKPRMASILPWLITSIAFLITAFSLFSTKRIFVDIHVVDEKSSLSAPALAPASSRESEASTGPAEQIPLEQFIFEGAAYLKSSRESGLLTLINSSVAPFARATLHFDKPTDLSRGKLVFYAKGNHGGENIAFALKDSENIQAFRKGKTYPFSKALTTSWQKAEIPLSSAVKDFDARNVTSLRFEFGSKDTDNRSGDTIFIKDLHWVAD